ncbi:NADH dehydrogenase [Rhodocyclaceae bacterium]|nr:NADH dehydrogenase [Rhodocyclaceae bacterium]
MESILILLPLAPFASMLVVLLSAGVRGSIEQAWRRFCALSVLALLCALALAVMYSVGRLPAAAVLPPSSGLALTTLGVWLAVLVQSLGTVIGVFSSRYLDGEPRQRRFIAALAGVLAAVHGLLFADHWLVLIAAWAAIGFALERLLCFYPERPFALLAAFKKRLADRVADGLLILAAALAWAEVGSGSLSALGQHLAVEPASAALQASAVCLVLAVILRTALLPVHGWLIQVMEAPTPVSALLHAGVVNLGGFVLIRFAPMLEAVPAARWLLVGVGLATAVLAGLVMLTRVSIKVRLAWSTVAQMGFMVLECGLGLYTLAAAHLIGHSLYKAHAFLAASSVVRDSKLAAMRGRTRVSGASLLWAPGGALAVVAMVQFAWPTQAWPWWWSGVLALAWAPLLWWPALSEAGARLFAARAMAGLAMLFALSVLATLAHALPIGLRDAPLEAAGVVALAGMAALYLNLALMQREVPRLQTWRRWAYAGFYLDEFYTRLALRVWPARWMPAVSTPTDPLVLGAATEMSNSK